MTTQFCSEPNCRALVPVGAGGRCQAHTRAFRNMRPAYPGERWYDSARWDRLRIQVIQAQPFCQACLARGVKTVTTEIDHIQKHDGDPVKFWNRANLQGLCKSCHTIKTSRGE